MNCASPEVKPVAVESENLIVKTDENWWKFFTDVHLRVTIDWTLDWFSKIKVKLAFCMWIMVCAPNYRCCFGKFGGSFWLSQAPMVSPAPAFGRWPLNRHQSNILPVPCWDQKRHPILAKSTNLETAGLNILWYTHTYHCIITYIYVYCIHEMLGMHQPCIMSLYIYVTFINVYYRQVNLRIPFQTSHNGLI